jgi:hypothetical protein
MRIVVEFLNKPRRCTFGSRNYEKRKYGLVKYIMESERTHMIKLMKLMMIMVITSGEETIR